MKKYRYRAENIFEFPIYPYQGVYGLETEEEVRKAIELMEFFSDPNELSSPEIIEEKLKRVENDCQHVWLIYYGCNRQDVFRLVTKEDYEQFYKNTPVIRLHKNHINLYWSPVHNHRCVTLAVAQKIAKELATKRQRKAEKEKARVEKLWKDLPTELKIEIDILSPQPSYQTYVLENRSEQYYGFKIVDILKPSGKTEIITERFVTAYSESEEDPVKFHHNHIITNNNGEENLYTQYREGGAFIKDCRSRENGMRGEIPGTEEVTRQYGDTRYPHSQFLRKLKAKDIKSLLTNGILKTETGW